LSSPTSATAPAPTPWSPGSAASSSSSPEPSVPPGRVGRDGYLRLGFERRGERTVLVERRFTLPLQALEPIDLDGSGAATLMLLNPTGGILGGDALDTSVALGAGSRVCLTTPAATRVYRSAGSRAVHRLRASVGEGARLEYVPDHLIPSPGARLRQATEVTLAAGATLLLAEAWAVGRVARGEQWCFDELDLGLLVRDERGLVLKERSVLECARRDGLGGAEGFGYLATFVAVAPFAGRWSDLARKLAGALDALDGGARFGVSALGRGGVLARVLCPSAPALEAAVLALWAESRKLLLGLAPLALRKL
jgi:urease accessory protein